MSTTDCADGDHDIPTHAHTPIRHRAIHLACALLLTVTTAGAPRAFAQPHPAPASTAVVPAPRRADVRSLDAIMKAAYATISGPAGHQRDWQRFRSLFIPGARLIPVHTQPDGSSGWQVLGVEDFIARAGPYMLKNGFYERETHRVVQRYGAVAQVFSTYASRHHAGDRKPFQRGINSFQLLYDGHRWWIVTIYWQGEHPGLPIPRRYGG